MFLYLYKLNEIINREVHYWFQLTLDVHINVKNLGEIDHIGWFTEFFHINVHKFHFL